MPFKTHSPLTYMLKQPKNLDVPQTDLTGRVVIVTGSNSGIGLEAARQFAAMKPARLILAVRRMDAGQTAADSIQASTGIKPEVWNLDMASFESVKSFASKCDKELERLDVFLANAGISPFKYKETEDGLESTLQVNTLSTTLLSVLLIPLLQRTAALPALSTEPTFKPRLTIVTSFVHYMVAELPGLEEGTVLKRANEEKNFVKLDSTYNNSKLILMFNIPVIAAKAGPSVIVTAVDPGFVKTDIMKDSTGVLSFALTGLANMFSRTASNGAKPCVWASVAPLEKSGLFSQSCEIKEPCEMIMTDTDGARAASLWKESQAVWKEKAGLDIPMTA